MAGGPCDWWPRVPCISIEAIVAIFLQELGPANLSTSPGGHPVLWADSPFWGLRVHSRPSCVLHTWSLVTKRFYGCRFQQKVFCREETEPAELMMLDTQLILEGESVVNLLKILLTERKYCLLLMSILLTSSSNR